MLPSIQTLSDLLGSTKPSFHCAFNSNDVQKEDVFFALKGKRSDGHLFLEQVARLGARYAVIDQSYRGVEPLQCVRVHDVLQTLQDLARQHVVLKKPKIVALSGDMGKTTTKEFVASLVADTFSLLKTQGSRNTQISLPTLILNELREQQLLLLEMGMTGRHQIERLVQIAPPQIAALTHLPCVQEEYIHASDIDSLDEILLGKAEIFSSSHTEIAIVPNKDMLVPSLQKRLYFSTEDVHAQFFGQIVDDRVHLYEKGKLSLQFTTDIPHHHLSNIVCGVSIARSLGISWQEIAQRVKFLQLPAMRFEKTMLKGIVLINDAYNSSYVALDRALSHLPQSKRSIAVLGHLSVVGQLGIEIHQRMINRAEQVFDKIYLFGSKWQKEWGTKCTIFETKEQIVSTLLSELQKGDMVYCKGARPLKLEEVMQQLIESL